ncbi:hypothetical protein GPK34_01410 [Secundilactobacillus kimchicus]|uniref:hypothetical protein n=1 Tax=Secundilactobacillus kimchicus TaxID=528209 RepID=UPI001C00D69E|nr:hypothetical protein [Secundilactobacillus kimchicus]MBT9670696.1 hypothetical protein [Secundilactobacillus kimchicus]
MKRLVEFNKEVEDKYQVKIDGSSSYQELNWFAVKLASYVIRHWAKKNGMTKAEAAEAYADMLVGSVLLDKPDRKE